MTLFTTENKFIRFLLSLGLLFLIVYLFDRAGGAILRHFYFSQTSGSGYRTTHSIDSTNADVLVFGSSRANHHYVPGVFEDSLRMSFYNTGHDGNFILYNYAVFKSILKRYTPKIIIMDVNPDELCYDPDSYDRLSSLLPYYKDHPEIRDIVELRSPFEKVKLFSSIYPFNSGLLTIGIGNLELNISRRGDDKGYVPLFGRMTDTHLISSEKQDNPVDSVKVEVINKIAQICKANQIDLFFIQSPVYAKADQSINRKRIEKTTLTYNAEYIDFSTDSIFLNNPSCFQDRSHLNNEGAIKFSSQIATIIKQKVRPFKNTAINFE